MSFNRALAVAIVALLTISTHGQSAAWESDWQRCLELDSLKKHKQALKILDRLVNEPGIGYRALLLRGEILFYHQERLQEAMVDIREAIQLEPDSMAAYLYRSSMYLSLLMPDRAVSDTDEALQRALDTKDTLGCYLNKGAALLMMRRMNDALTVIDMALELDPEHHGMLVNKATVLDELERFSEAREIFLALHQRDTTDMPVLNNLGFNADKRGDHEDAIRWFTKAKKLEPDDAVVLNNLGHAQLRIGLVDEALRNVQRSIKLYPVNSYAYRNLGLIWQAKGEKEKACSAFEEALELGFTGQYGPEVAEWRKEYCP